MPASVLYCRSNRRHRLRRPSPHSRPVTACTRTRSTQTMTRLYNDPADFADEVVDGLLAANRRYLRRVPGGVVRRVRRPADEVAVIVGGGSGHYPAFGVLVGEGLAHGAVLGNLFASPSAEQ